MAYLTPEERYQVKRKLMLHARSKTNGGKGNNYGLKYNRTTPTNGPYISKENMAKAIEGSCGMYVEIAERLNVRPKTVMNKLALPDWQDMKELFEDEKKNFVRTAERRVLQLMKQTDDTRVALAAAKFVLQSKGEREYKREQINTIQGGDPSRPVNVHQTEVIDIDALNMSILERRNLMNKLDMLKSQGTIGTGPVYMDPGESAHINNESARPNQDNVPPRTENPGRFTLRKRR